MTKTAPAVDSAVRLKIAKKASEHRDVQLEIENLQDRLKVLNSRSYAIEREELPELMSEAGVDSFGIPADGNEPAWDLKMKPFYSANIAAGWEPEKRNAAFDYLTSNGAGDLIKTQIVIDFPREDRAEALKVAKRLENLKPTVKESVHSATLTSWVKEKSEAGDHVDLDKIGGQVGNIVKPKARKA